MATQDYLTSDQLNEINEYSIPFPIFFSKDGDESKLLQALLITDIGAPTTLGMPETIEMEKHTPGEIVTSGVYVLVESYKAHASKYLESESGKAEDN